MRKLFFAVVVLSAVVSCKKEQVNSNSEISQKETDKNGAKMPPVFMDSLQSSDKMIDFVKTRKAEISKILDEIPAEKTVELYNNYRKENDFVLTLLFLKNQELLDNFSDFSNYDEATQKSTLKIPDPEKGQVKKLNDAGIEIWDIGEAMFDLRMFPDLYKNAFAKKSSADLKEYLDNQANEDKDLFSADAAIIVEWPEIERRILFRENLLKKYPQTALKKFIQNELQFYRRSYIIGMDNTPTFEDNSNTFAPKYLNYFKNFIAKNPNSETSIFLKSLLSEKLTNEQVFDKVDKKFPYQVIK